MNLRTSKFPVSFGHVELKTPDLRTMLEIDAK